VDGKISDSGNDGQLRRVIRYLKAWKDHREGKNSSIRLLSGFILTILTCEHFSKNERDDVSLYETIYVIKSRLGYNFSCYVPETQGGENLLQKYSSETVMDELKDLTENAEKAINSDCEKEASEYWRKSFGDRFPLGDDSNKGAKTSAFGAAPAGLSYPVPAQKPYGGSEASQQKIVRQKAWYSPEDFEKVKRDFPNLEYCESENCVKGKIFVSGRYEQNENGSWNIMPIPESGSDDSFAKEYSILINLNNRVKVYETAGEIIQIVKKSGKENADLHLFLDDSCCLGVFLSCFSWEMRLSKFIVYGIYPYFAWQAYYAKFGKCPPCGEYPHNWEDAKKEFLDDIKNRRADDPIFAKAAQSLNLTAEAKNKAVSNSP
jgi:hypothetical protein